MTYDLFYHGLMLVVVVLLWRFLLRSVPTSLFRFGTAALVGAVAAAVLSLANGRLAAHGWAWEGSLFLFGAALLLGRQKIHGERRLGFALTVSFSTAIYFALCVQALLIEPTALEVKRYVVRTPRVTRPMRIAFLADFQADVIGDYERKTLQLLKEQNADLILLGGDYLQSHTPEHENRLCEDFNRLLKEIDLEAPWGVFALKGNQEDGLWFGWLRFFEGTRIIPVRGTHSWDVGEIRLTALGMHDSFRAVPMNDRHTQGKFRIIAGHAPRFALGNPKADLLLAGHTHGGQIRIPGVAPLMTATDDLPRTWAAGLTLFPKGGALIVSNGSGHERGRAPRVRLFCRPDLIVIDLQPFSVSR